MRIGLTGYSGYIGSRLFEYLSLHSGFEIYYIGRVSPVSGKFIDINKPVDNKIKIDVLINCAAFVPDNQSSDDIEIELINSRLLFSILDCIQLSTCCRILHLSSLHIEDRQGSRCVYESSKLSSEILLRTICFKYDIKLQILRLGYVYGSKMRHGFMFKRFIDALCAGKQIELYNNGKDRHHLVYIDDVVQIMYRILTEFQHEEFISPLWSNCIYNTRQILDCIASALVVRADVVNVNNESVYRSDEYEKFALFDYEFMSLEETVQEMLRSVE